MGNSALRTYAVMRTTKQEHNNLRNNGGIDNRFRDRNGREHYDNGRFAPMRSEYTGAVGRYDNIHTNDYDSRYSPIRSEYDSPQMGYSEPVRMDWRDQEQLPRRKWDITEYNAYEPNYEPEYNQDGMRRVVGFVGSSRVDHRRMNEMEHRTSRKHSGHAQGHGIPKLTREMAEYWMEMLQNADGSHGPHWTFEEVKNLMQSRNVQEDPLLVWVGMNAEYSDRVMINRKYGVDRPEYYLDAAVANWVNDKDAVEDKAAAYFMYVVKH